MATKEEEKAQKKFEKKKAKEAKRAAKKTEPKVRSYQRRDQFVRQMKYWVAFFVVGTYRNTACRIKLHWWSKFAEPKKMNVHVGYKEVYDAYYNRVKTPIYEDRQYQFRICQCCTVITSKRFVVKG